MRAEFTAIAAGFGLLPTLSGNNGCAFVVNSSGSAVVTTTGTLALAGNFATTGAFATTLAQQASVTLTLPAVSGTLATLAGTETLSNKTLVGPALGTPVSGNLSNCTGTATGLTAGATQTNANLSGVITSSGNVTSTTAQTGTGSTFVMQTGPTLTAPVLGTPASGTLTNCTGFPASALAGATLASGVTASSLTSFGSSIALGTPASGVLTNCTGTASGLTAGAVAAANITGTTLASNITASSLTSFGASIALAQPASGDLRNCTQYSANNLQGTTLANNVVTSSLTSVGNGIALGTPASGVLTNCSGTASGLTAGAATTATNQSGGTVNATTGSFSAGITVNTSATFNTDIVTTGKNKATGYYCRSGGGGSYDTNVFNIHWDGANASLWIDSTEVGVFAYTSDRRIKQNIVTAPAGALDRVMRWRTVNYELADVGMWRADRVQRLGFIADELQQATPAAVMGASGAVQEDGSIVPQTLLPIPMIAELAAALQEAIARIAVLEARA